MCLKFNVINIWNNSLQFTSTMLAICISLYLIHELQIYHIDWNIVQQIIKFIILSWNLTLHVDKITIFLRVNKEYAMNMQ